ncbi:MAG: hypothetical protein NTY48_02905 [Candidatus Diapherotrites archaeon]|nr:hypothetical protein [Candidatus Diapherotrites archaeon]
MSGSRVNVRGFRITAPKKNGGLHFDCTINVPERKLDTKQLLAYLRHKFGKRRVAMFMELASRNTMATDERILIAKELLMTSSILKKKKSQTK